MGDKTALKLVADRVAILFEASPGFGVNLLELLINELIK